MNMKRAQRKKWLNPIYRNKTVKAIMKASRNSPNKKEKLLGKHLENWYPGKFKFVGAGELVIDGKCPDFVSEDNKLVEMFGDYWHKGETGESREIHFKKRGYKTLIVWEHELNNERDLYKKVKEFVECQ